MKYQTDQNKAGEVAFRRRAAAIDSENPKPMLEITIPRMTETVDTFKWLVDTYGLVIGSGTVIAEIGAERCQRIAALMGHYQLKEAYAFDLSPDMLAASKVFCRLAGQNEDNLKLVPGDILDTRLNGFDIVFCFATLHHFPDPYPVFEKVHKMLKPGGYFYFDREAMRSWLGMHEVARIGAYLKFGGIPERRWGILETQFTLEQWLRAFRVFAWQDVFVKYPQIPGLYNVNLADLSSLRKFIVQLLGGRVYGLLRK